MTTPAELLDFWFSERVQPLWYKSDPAFDREIADRFGEAAKAAASGRLTAWRETPEGALALVLLLDQAPRNLHRGTPRAFATDATALAEAEAAIERGFDRALAPEQRVFLYLPFMHAEAIEAQERGVSLFTALGQEYNLAFMTAHRDIIARFGRFPHRNAILGRDSTPEEEEFLKDPKAWF